MSDEIDAGTRKAREHVRHLLEIIETACAQVPISARDYLTIVAAREFLETERRNGNDET